MSVSIADCLLRAAELTASDSARLDVELLLAHVLDKNRSFLMAWPEKALSEDQQQAFEKMFRRRIQGEPIAYILGEQGFWNLELEVSPFTLIPRPETELLVELALEKAKSEMRILDLGTGTGAIALAVAKELADSSVVGVDAIPGAIELAQRNQKKNAVTNAEFICSNWFDSVQGHFDLIISNPPYIEESDPHLTRGDVRFEPVSALVAGKDGLDDIRIIIRESKKYLFEQGWLLIEHGYKQAEAVRQLFIAAGFDEVSTVKDLSNNDRVTLGRLNY